MGEPWSNSHQRERIGESREGLITNQPHIWLPYLQTQAEPSSLTHSTTPSSPSRVTSDGERDRLRRRTLTPAFKLHRQKHAPTERRLVPRRLLRTTPSRSWAPSLPHRLRRSARRRSSMHRRQETATCTASSRALHSATATRSPSQCRS